MTARRGRIIHFGRSF